jgi:hypothetical protein
MIVRRASAWIGANLAALVLVPLAGLLIWVAIWRIWLPPAGGGATARTVTTVSSNAPTTPTHKVTTVVKRSGTTPSRRSEVLALALVFLGAGAAIVGVFNRRIGSFELDKDGVKVVLTPEEQAGAAALVGRLAAGGAGGSAYARGVERYVRAVAVRRPDSPRARNADAAAVPAGSLTADEATSLADSIAETLVRS